VVHAPARISAERLDAMVLRKRGWVLEKLRLASDPEATRAPRRVVDGETFLYLGRPYRLRIRPGHGRAGSVRLSDGSVEITLTPRSVSTPDAARKALVAWYAERAAAHAGSHVVHWASRLEVPVPEVRIRNQRARWGSCDRRGIIRINWRIVQAPMRLVDYLIAHELTHLREPGHTAAFWRVLTGVMPDAKARRGDLRKMVGLMDW
jgi:predicted metal-dependent hydrolase